MTAEKQVLSGPSASLTSTASSAATTGKSAAFIRCIGELTSISLFVVTLVTWVAILTGAA